MSKIEFPNKGVGDQFSASEANEIKSSVNSLYDDVETISDDIQDLIDSKPITTATETNLTGLLYGNGVSVVSVDVGNGLSLASNTLSNDGILGSTGATDNAILRADGTGGATLQSSGVTISDNNEVLIVSGASSAIPLRVRGAASQTGNLQEWQNSAGTIQARIANNGEIISSTASINTISGTIINLGSGAVGGAVNLRGASSSNGSYGILYSLNRDATCLVAHSQGGGRNIIMGRAGTNGILSEELVVITTGATPMTGFNGCYFGRGTESSGATTLPIRATRAQNSNQTATDLILSPGVSRGNAPPAKIRLQQTTPVESGTTLQEYRIAFEIDGNNTNDETPMLLLDCNKGTLQRVSIGDIDSGGMGFKVLRIPN
jgi:hypothetical protein